MRSEKTWTSALNGGADLHFSSPRSAGRSRDTPARGWATSLAGQTQTKCDNAELFLLVTEAASAGTSLAGGVVFYSAAPLSAERVQDYSQLLQPHRRCTSGSSPPLELTTAATFALNEAATDAAPPEPRRVWNDASLQQRFRNFASQVFGRQRVEPTFPPPEGEPRADGAALV